MRKEALLLFALLLFSGCTINQGSLDTVFKSMPQVEEFIRTHPNATVVIVKLNETEVEDASEQIMGYCGKALSPQVLYFGRASYKNFELVAYFDRNYEMLCMVSKTGEEGIKEETEEITEPQEEITLLCSIEDSQVLLNWSASQSANFKYYKVVRSNSNPTPSYPADGYIAVLVDRLMTEYVDKAPKEGTNYYRITVVKSDDSKVNSNVCAISISLPELETASYSVYDSNCVCDGLGCSGTYDTVVSGLGLSNLFMNDGKYTTINHFSLGAGCSMWPKERYCPDDGKVKELCGEASSCYDNCCQPKAPYCISPNGRSATGWMILKLDEPTQLRVIEIEAKYLGYTEHTGLAASLLLSNGSWVYAGDTGDITNSMSKYTIPIEYELPVEKVYLSSSTWQVASKTVLEYVYLVTGGEYGGPECGQEDGSCPSECSKHSDKDCCSQYGWHWYGDDCHSEPYAPVSNQSIELFGQLQSDGVFLNWTSYTGGNFKYYKVVRSTSNPSPVYPADGYIAVISNSDNSQYLDADFSGVLTYYRISTVLNDESKIHSNVFTIENSG